MNYLGPGTSYEKWVKTYGSTQTKSWLPYKWFTNSGKLDYEGLPPYRDWFSRLKNEFVLTPKKYDECKCVFRERGMKTFADWLKYYNNLDVGPFLEALEKMRGFYTALGIDIFKDAVSLLGFHSWGFTPGGSIFCEEHRANSVPQSYMRQKERLMPC